MRREYQSRSKVSEQRRFAERVFEVFFGVWLAACANAATAAELAASLPAKLTCSALQTAGLHDYAGAPEDYEASTFFESKFKLAINKVLMQHLAPEQSVASNPTDLFLTMLPRNEDPIELRCRQVQGSPGELGFSCVNTPPSELILINATSLRFTRSSIGGWVFGSAPLKSDKSDVSDNATNQGDQNAQDKQESATSEQALNPGLADDSLFVEYGRCE